MVVIVGLIVVLVAVTFVLTRLTSVAGTHDSFAILGQRIGGSVVAVRDCARGDGVGMAKGIVGRRAAPAKPDLTNAIMLSHN
jgi:hypothetical protein